MEQVVTYGEICTGDIVRTKLDGEPYWVTEAITSQSKDPNFRIQLKLLPLLQAVNVPHWSINRADKAIILLHRPRPDSVEEVDVLSDVARACYALDRHIHERRGVPDATTAQIVRSAYETIVSYELGKPSSLTFPRTVGKT